jgi:deoxyribose-phosphate aldolase
VKQLNRYFDHTLLKPDASEEQIEQLCREARQYSFHSVCVNSCYVHLAATLLENSSVAVTSVIGFPLGAMATEAKAYEAETALRSGADELDMVINIGALKSANFHFVEDDIAAVAGTAKRHHALLKVIMETHLLTREELITACRLAMAAGADFVKTSTGFTGGGAKVEDVALMKRITEGRIRIKASGGIRDLATAKAMIDAGADRLGASASVSIMREAERENI